LRGVSVNEVKLGLLNIQGLIGKSYNKLDSNELRTIFQNNDILFLTETWLNDMFNDNVENFDHYFLNRKRKAKGAKRDCG